MKNRFLKETFPCEWVEIDVIGYFVFVSLSDSQENLRDEIDSITGYYGRFQA